MAASQRRAFPNFNSRPCERGDWPSPAPQPARAYFNSRPCERGDHPPPRGRPAVKISIHAPARGATIKEYQQAIELPISIHAPARGATSFSVFSAICDSISIHAPARGATQGPPQGGQGQTLISIHAPARGATSAGDQERCPGADFNSRPCERGDAAREVVRKRANISIHAPARGATCPGGTHKITPKHFNSRPCERGDKFLGGAIVETIAISIHAPARGATHRNMKPNSNGSFQFTPLREGRLIGVLLVRHLDRHFNSRPCERGDTDTYECFKRRINFNSRPCERGDPPTVRVEPHPAISIHAPARGATKGKLQLRHRHRYFNSRPCERGDGKIKQNMLCFFCNYREKLLTFRQHQLS